MALALALAKRPDLLVLDEPLASLDPLARREFLQVLMGAVADDGVTVVFSSHVIGELERVCDHLVVLNHGRIACRETSKRCSPTTGCWSAPARPTTSTTPRASSKPPTPIGTPPCWFATAASHPHPAGKPQAVSLEELVLGYLRLPAHHGTGLAAEDSEVAA